VTDGKIELSIVGCQRLCIEKIEQYIKLAYPKVNTLMLILNVSIIPKIDFPDIVKLSF
jgi:hypothetical protein